MRTGLGENNEESWSADLAGDHLCTTSQKLESCSKQLCLGATVFGAAAFLGISEFWTVTDFMSLCELE